jgi:hypothetical protein
MASRDKSIYFARLAEQGERYEDMIRYMKEVVKVRMVAAVVVCHPGLDIWQFQ